tara:strand:+ start:1813 stop:3003 length:1191 start_codon:yes stop_codon:yes gene_type:complete
MAIAKKDWFILDPNPIYLTHGNFGGCLKSAFEDRLKWYQKLESNPHQFLVYELFSELEKSRLSLSKYLDCSQNNLVYFHNPSTALNAVIRSLNLNEKDEVLATNHEYGALDKTWQYYSEKKGFEYKKININVPFDDEEIFIQSFLDAINQNTKIIFLSHITSSTALIFPVKRICEIAKQHNILTIIDGAHGPAQVDFSISDMNPDIYVGACHKWMCAPKGVSFLYANKDIQDSIDPLVISWGWRGKMFKEQSQYINCHQWQGTDDLSAYLTIPTILNFFKKHDWNNVRSDCHNLILDVKDMFSKLGSKCQPTSNNENHIGQMLSFKLNQESKLIDNVINNPNQVEEVQNIIFNQSKIHIPIIIWDEQVFMRVSIQAYNSRDDINVMFEMLKYFNLL